jgi:hypothetical protein
MDINTKHGYNIPDDFKGWALIQHGYACLGLGATENEAIEDCERWSGEPIDRNSLVSRECDIEEGSLELIEIT